MSISVQRQYSSPNCILSLQGFTDENISPEGSPVMTVLTLAQCQILGNPNVLTGGITLVQNLVRAVSAYSQEMLSGLSQAEKIVDSLDDYITIEKLPEKHRHRLRWQEKKEQIDNQIEIDLTTVQLFDLLETIDQLCADQNTLPQVTDELHPLSRRHRRAEVSIVEQSTPATVGLASLALAAVALFMLPNPVEIKDPNLEQKITPPPTETVPEQNSQPTPPTSP
jgi:hypothetical protein